MRLEVRAGIDRIGLVVDDQHAAVRLGGDRVEGARSSSPPTSSRNANGSSRRTACAAARRAHRGLCANAPASRQHRHRRPRRRGAWRSPQPSRVRFARVGEVERFEERVHEIPRAAAPPWSTPGGGERRAGRGCAAGNSGRRTARTRQAPCRRAAEAGCARRGQPAQSRSPGVPGGGSSACDARAEGVASVRRMPSTSSPWDSPSVARAARSGTRAGPSQPIGTASTPARKRSAPPR